MSEYQDRSTLFHNYLRERGIGEFSPCIPDGIGQHIIGIPSTEELHQIPQFEQFPLSISEKSENITLKDLKLLFVQSQIQQISNSTFSTNLIDFINGDLLNIPINNDKINDFIEFKRQLSTFYLKQSELLNLTPPISICSNLLCLNNSIPTFKYCIHHINNEENILNQNLLSNCLYISKNGKKCNKICSKEIGLCSFHKNKK